MAKYKIGTSDPKIAPDVGAGVWNSTKATYEMIAKKVAILNILPHAYVIIGDDATKHMFHYLHNTGKDEMV